MLDKTHLTKRILEISYEHKLSHLGSVLSVLPILINIYERMEIDDECVLSCGHAGLAQYVILESLGHGDAEEMLNIAGIHPDRVLNKYMEESPIACSTGSLGQGLPIALGMSIADKARDVYCVISDGECYEGSIWEALQLKDRLLIDNLKVFVNANGHSAYSVIDRQLLEMRLRMFDPNITIYYTNSEVFPFLNGIDSHYHVMNEDEYRSALVLLEETL